MPGKLYGAAAEFVARKYGGGMAETEATFDITTSFARVLGNDPERVFVLVVNLSVNNIWLGFDTDVSLTNGIQLSASGGSLEIDVESDFVLPIRAIYGVSDAVSSRIYVLTVRREFVVTEPETVDAA